MPLLVLIFIVVPLVELYVIVQVGQEIGVLPTLVILLLDSILGSWLLKTQGRVVWRRFNEAMAAGRMPHSEIIDGVLVIFGGAFLITPGFITDLFGVLLLLPPTRAAFRRMTRRVLERRMLVRVGGAAVRAGRAGRAERGVPPDADYDVEGTASEIHDDPRSLPRRGSAER